MADNRFVSHFYLSIVYVKFCNIGHNSNTLYQVYENKTVYLNYPYTQRYNYLI